MASHTSKSSWKELKSAINSSISIPSQKQIRESSMGVDPDDKDALKKGGKDKKKRSSSIQRSSIQLQHDVEDKDAQIKKLRRENAEMKRKLHAQQGDLRKLQIEKKRSGSTTPRNSSRRSSGLNMNESEVQDML